VTLPIRSLHLLIFSTVPIFAHSCTLSVEGYWPSAVMDLHEEIVADRVPAIWTAAGSGYYIFFRPGGPRGEKLFPKKSAFKFFFGVFFFRNPQYRCMVTEVPITLTTPR